MSENVIAKKSNVLIIVLAIIALVLGVAIYRQGAISNFFPGATPKLSVSPTPSSVAQSSKPRRPLPTNLTADEKLLMSPPAPTDSQEVKSKHFAIVQKLAQEASVLELNKCNKPSPLNLKLKAGQDFKVRNTDSVAHTIIIDSDNTFSVPANSTATFKAEFGHGQGAYGYLCDDLSGVAGFFFVTPK